MDFSLMAHITYYIIISLYHLYIFLDIYSKCNCSIIPFYLISNKQIDDIDNLDTLSGMVHDKSEQKEWSGEMTAW